MALANYSDLKASITRWMERSDVSGDAADFISLGEASLNRELGAVETDQALVGVLGSPTIDISSYSVVLPLGVFYVNATGNETELTPAQSGDVSARSFGGVPTSWAMDGNNLRFERPLSGPLNFRMRFRQKFALSDSAPTNWLLTNHPDIYLAASIVWGGVFVQDVDLASAYSNLLTAKLPEVKRILALSRRGNLRVESGLAGLGRCS